MRYLMRHQLPISDTFGRAARHQFHTLVALIVSEAHTRFARRSLGLIEELGSIVIHVIGFSALRIAVGANTHYGMAEIPFLTSGVFIYWMLKSNMISVSFYHTAKSRYSIFPRVTQIDILVARSVVNTMLYLGIALSTFGILILLGYSDAIRSLWKVIGILLLTGLFGLCIGLVLGGVYTFAPILRTLTSGFLRILMYTSGIFFVWPEAPHIMRTLIFYNPIFHLEEMMRSAYFPMYDSAVADPGYIAVWMLLSGGIGLVIERLCRPYNLRLNKRQEAEDRDVATMNAF